MKKYIFLNKIDDVGVLYIDQVFLEFEKIPILFSCVDESDNLYLCLCSEIRKIQRWIISPIDNTLLIDMLKDKITIYEAFINSVESKLVIEYNKQNEGQLKIEKVKFSSLTQYDLPDEGEFLEDEESFCDYIKKLETKRYINKFFIKSFSKINMGNFIYPQTDHYINNHNIELTQSHYLSNFTNIQYTTHEEFFNVSDCYINDSKKLYENLSIDKYCVNTTMEIEQLIHKEFNDEKSNKSSLVLYAA